MALTEDGAAVPERIGGIAALHEPPPGAGKAPGIPDVHEDGFVPRNSGRGGLYPHAPQHYLGGPERPAAGRLDEVVTAPKPEVPAALQAPRSPLASLPAAAMPAVTE